MMSYSMSSRPVHPSHPWYPSGLPQEAYRHTGSAFQTVGVQKSNFAINPDWVSEKINGTPQFAGRKYQPWAFEFSGARHWPYGSVENKEALLNHGLRSRGTRPTADLTPRANVYLRRGQSAMSSSWLSPRDQDTLHPPALMMLTERQSHWLPPASGAPYRQNRNSAHGITFDFSPKPGPRERQLVDPNLAEYLDTEAIPPSRGRAYREVGLGAGDYMAPVAETSRRGPPPKPYVNFVSYNWV